MLILGSHASGCVSSVEIVGGANIPLRFELRGTKGALEITGHHPGGYQCGHLTVDHDAALPAAARAALSPGSTGNPLNVAQLWARFEADIRTGTRTVPDFDVAVRLARLLDAIDAASDQRRDMKSAKRQTGVTMTWTIKTDPSGWQTRWSDEHSPRAGWPKATGPGRPCAMSPAHALPQDPGKVMLIEGENRLTRGECWDQALRLAAWFLARGLKPGDVISFQLPNWVEVSVIALAARMSGLVINPIPPIYRESELAYILADCGSKLIFVPGTFRKCDHTAMVEGLRGQLPALSDVVVVRGAGTLVWEDIIAGAARSRADLPAIDPAAVIIAMYTSGTTGRPKCVLHTHYTYGHRVNAMAVAYGMSAGRRHLHALARHAYHRRDLGFRHAVGRGQHQRADGRLVARGRHCLHRAAWLHGHAAGQRRSSSRCSMWPKPAPSGCAPAPVLLRRHHSFARTDQARRRHGAAGLFYRAYGSTECLTATLGHTRPGQTPISARKPTGASSIRSKCASSMPPRADGIARRRGRRDLPARARAVRRLSRPGRQRRQFRARRLLQDGRPRQAGARQITWSSPAAQRTSSSARARTSAPRKSKTRSIGHPAVAEVAIVAMPSAKTGEMGCAFIIPRAGQTIDLPEIMRFLDEAGLARQKFPEHLVLVDDLPRVPSGKVRKDVLRERAKEIAEAG